MKILRLLLASIALSGGAALATTALAPPASSAPVPACVTSQIHVSAGQAEGAAGTTFVPLVFTNTGATCALEGVPAIHAVTASRHAVGPTARSLSGGKAAVLRVLATGRAASVALGVVDTGNYPVADCHAKEAAGVEVRLGRYVAETFIPMRISVCTSRASLTTQLVVPGDTGY